jgi:type II secretory pathway component PulK
MMSRCAEKGSTLIMVTWLLLLIAVIAGFLLYRAELEWAVTLNLERNQEVRELAREILTEHLALLAADDNDYDAPQEPWFNQAGVFTTKRHGYQVTLVIEDEGSKPKLNLLSEKGLAQLLGDGLSPDPVLDWIDSDRELRAEGAEAPYYQGLNSAYQPRDGFVASLRELLQIKDGVKYYEKLAPWVTVYGKYNPNVLTAEQFGELLLAYGFAEYWVERVKEEFAAYREKARFEALDDLLKLPAVTITTRDKLKPILQFSGSCNLNFVSQTGLAAILSEAGQKRDWAADLAARCQAQPFTTVEEIKRYFKSKNAKFKPKDYFTVDSTIFRYRIWLMKNNRIFYLETVQERIAGKHRNKRQIRPLSWLELKDAAAPPLPVTATAQKQEGEDQTDASQSNHH